VSRGTVAAGHPETAAAGVWALREGGNAVDAAIAAVCASLSAESPLTGLGAGGYMLVHEPGTQGVLLDFFVAAPGRDDRERRSELVPVEVDFGGTTQIFNVGAASCGVPGTPAGLDEACRLFGSMPLAELVRPGVRLAREGVRITRQQGYIISILAPVLTHQAEGAAIYAPGGALLREGAVFEAPELAESLEVLGEEGAEPFYGGEIGARICSWVADRGGRLSREDMVAYRPVAREPVRAEFGGHRVLTNPPPSSGGLLIAFALAVLERLQRVDVESVVTVMEQAQAARTPDFLDGLYREGFAGSFMTEEAVTEAVRRCRAPGRPVARSGPDDALGSTTHITAVDSEGRCASVTCSNGTGSGLFLPGTGIHVNNMLGEQDLNPFGFHTTEPGRRMPSMMSPTVVLSGEELEAGLGSGGSNRIRSAIVQTILRLMSDRMPAQGAVAAPRVHVEDGIVHAEPGIDEAALDRLDARGYEIVRWRDENLFFGGVHAVARDPGTGLLAGGGDPRRGGAVAVA
jgi:gamma-glutamyltranspeptidase/glutathione hydrolase